MPNRVRQAIDNYQSEANTINQFINDEEIFERVEEKDYSQAVKVTDKSLYERYRIWCKDNGTFSHSKSNFKKHLRKHKNYVKDSRYKNIKYKDVLKGYRLRPLVNDERGSSNPDRLVAISKRELDKLKE